MAAMLCAISFISVSASSRDARADPVAQPVSSSSPVASSTPGSSISSALSTRQPEAISANPGAVDIVIGTGLLGRLIRLDKIPGVRLGGLWIGNSDYLITGGIKPHSWSFNSLLVVNLNVDAEKLADIPGASFDAALLQFNGENVGHRAGVVIGYDGLPGPGPLVRTQLYELWWRQKLFDDHLILRVGKTVPTYDFDNVSRPIPVEDQSLSIPSVTSLIYTPIFKNPTMIGLMPGYYNSAYGITAQYVPTRNIYFTYAFYDGALGTGVQTGLREAPVFNGHYFTIAEGGYAWMLGDGKMPGTAAAGGWAETGHLANAGAEENGAHGFYSFGSQRLWRRHAGIDNSGISGFFQFGINDSRTTIANEYFGLGLTGFGLIPRRPADSLGAGIAWSWLNRRFGFRSNELMLQTYYQMHLIGSTFLQPTMSYIPNPGIKPGSTGVVAATMQVIVLF